ncbi:unnamed protein product [Microthlaspi erraticum]|uniref:Uncharacterized protein n=1 Tax=Microthlaspi erraticum TaxID=1685480 RepID=A0A6D2HKS1_9BRAS|nr:unnamed protein product [Microthlaspi erraticum]CAA7029929.1 unnamed protein product [Microthlaspi erraticum]
MKPKVRDKESIPLIYMLLISFGVSHYFDMEELLNKAFQDSLDTVAVMFEVFRLRTQHVLRCVQEIQR